MLCNHSKDLRLTSKQRDLGLDDCSQACAMARFKFRRTHLETICRISWPEAMWQCSQFSKTNRKSQLEP